MSERHQDDSRVTGETDPQPGKGVSRREFLKIAGVAGATVGLGAGLGGVLAACGGAATTTTTTAAAPGSSTTAAPESSTTVTSAAETGPEIKLGFVTPKTGALAPFASTDAYILDVFTKWVGDGQVLGDNKKHPISVAVQDSQSDTNRASQVAGDLINNGGITLMVVASTPDTINPVAAQCEAGSTPCLANDVPYQAFLGAAPKDGYKWSWLLNFGVEDFAGNYTKVWTALPTNKKIGVMWPNDADGSAFSSFMPDIIKSVGLTIVDGGRWQDGSEDFTQQITLFKKEGCEVMEGVFSTPDYTNFWKQCNQQGWVPKIACVDKGLLFPKAIEAVGAIGIGLVSTLFWAPTWPYKSYLTGETCQQFADSFTKASGEQWSSALSHGTIFEMAAWVLQNATDPTSKTSIQTTAATMKFDTMVGPIDFSAPVITASPVPVGPGHVADHVYKSPCMAGQWVKGTTYPFNFVGVANVAAPNIPVDAQLVPIGG